LPAVIDVRDLAKHYRVHKRPPGLGPALRSLLHRTFETVRAVDGITFSVAPGERVGFLGPNGAGKTTTLKILSGLLHPTAGAVAVAGHEPRRRDPAFLKSITLVMGQKQQLLWDLPPAETFALNRAIYDIPHAQFAETVSELSRLLELGDLTQKPTRQLSLGERMKCELVAGLLHRPQVIFLDEPTLGLDISMQSRLRRFVRDYNQRHGATVILTSHYMADVVALCPRVILIHHGQLLYDGGLTDLAARLAPFKLIRVGLSADRAVPDSALPIGVEVILREDDHLELRAPRSDTPAIMAQLLNTLPITDLAVEDPPIEAVIDQIYQEGAV